MNRLILIQRIALREIGHALGFVGWDSFNQETSDGDIDVRLAPWSGSELPASDAHLETGGTIMSYAGPPNIRRDVTQADLVGVCQLSQFTSCDLSLRPTSEIADSNQDNDVDGQDFLAWQTAQSPTALVAFGLNDWEDSYGISPFHPSDSDHDSDVEIDG